MNKYLLFTAALLGFLSAGCTSAPTRVDEGPLKARTFSFVNPGANAVPAYAEKRAEVHALIQDAIAQSLIRRGLKEIPAGGDLTVAYLVIIGNNVSTMSVDDYFGYGRDPSGLLKKAHDKATIDHKNPNAFEAGTLVIDILSGTEFDLAWRNFVTRPIFRDATDEARKERIAEAVDEALRTLRIKK